VKLFEVQKMKKAARVVTTLASLFIFATSARAAELNNNWLSTRALGMGNAYTAIAADADSLFYNPAGLANVSGVNWTFFDLHGGLNGMEAIENAKIIAGAPDDMQEALRKLYGKKVWVGGGAKTAVTVPYFGVAGFVNASSAVTTTNAPNPRIEPTLTFDYGAVAGFALPVIPGIASVGFSMKRINRTGTSQSIGAATLATLDSEALKEEFKRRGTGYGLDFGAQFKFPGPVSPSLSFVYRDLGYTTFTHEEGAGAPSRIEPEMVIGGGLEISAPLIKVTPVFDYRYLNRPELQMGKKINLGLEVSLPLLDLRAGLHQGYYSAGVGLNLALLQVDVATWGTELGEYPGQREDRRYMAQFTFELGFDPLGFFGGLGRNSSGSGPANSPSGSSTSGSSSRRLKQRR
jgi:hypothetical protein